LAPGLCFYHSTGIEIVFPSPTGYRDQVSWVEEAGVVGTELRTLEASGSNVLEHWRFHEVAEVEPNTWTVFAGSRSQPGWGYLDVETGHYTHHAAIASDPNFAAVFQALNPSPK
jgi:hypothetical protein